MTKTKILVCSESSKVKSGFGVYNKYLLENLFKTQKYDIAEFASYGMIGDRERFNIPWKYYANAIIPNDPRFEEYNSNTENHFGKWRFDRVLLDFRPDIVIDVRDYWMSSYQMKSPLRKYFHWILMPTVDSSPQQEEWLDTYINANAIFTYSDWGADVLKQQTSNAINYIDTVSPCADASVFEPLNLASTQVKSSLGIPADSIVIGTVMRNQKRKLFPELIRLFDSIVEELEQTNPKQANKLYLYIHSSYPDAGWDFPNLVKNSKNSSRILFTYSCKNCGAVIGSCFSGHQQRCVSCRQNSMVIPNVSNGIDDSVLSKIIGCLDVYIQYSICEGFGMPQIEAATCGVPVVTTNYSAMEDIINKLGAVKVDIGAYFKELETSAIRTYPDQNDAKRQLLSLINSPEGMRKKIGYEIRKRALTNYNWETVMSKWINYIDSLNGKLENKWSAPINIISTIKPEDIPQVNSIYYIIHHLINTKGLQSIGLKISDYWILKQIQMAENGFVQINNETRPFALENIIHNLNQIIENNNIAEKVRVNTHLLSKEDYIDYANNK